MFDATYMRNSSVPQEREGSVSNSEFESRAGNAKVPSDFQKLMEAVDVELYPGCQTFKKLEFIITLLHIKVTNRWSDKSFQSLLEILHKAFNYVDGCPKSSYEATITKSMARIIGLNAASFIAECSNWVRHYYPLNSRYKFMH